jgi:hypothetical protein
MAAELLGHQRGQTDFRRSNPRHSVLQNKLGARSRQLIALFHQEVASRRIILMLRISKRLTGVDIDIIHGREPAVRTVLQARTVRVVLIETEVDTIGTLILLAPQARRIYHV